jgi:hypothetical protein
MQIMMIEDDMHDLLNVEKDRVDQAQQAQLVAEKALQDSLSVNVCLQKQVLPSLYCPRVAVFYTLSR